MPIQMPTCISSTLTMTLLVTAAQVCLMSLLTKMEFTPVFLSTKSARETMLLLTSLLMVSHERKPFNLIKAIIACKAFMAKAQFIL